MYELQFGLFTVTAATVEQDWGKEETNMDQVDGIYQQVGVTAHTVGLWGHFRLDDFLHREICTSQIPPFLNS